MIIGLDLDNTIICYDRLFHRLALERDLIPRELPESKSAVRDYLRRMGCEKEWTALQGEAYGRRIDEADIFPGAIEFLELCRDRGVRTTIISHKTKTPISGPSFDLHEAALRLLRRHGFFTETRTGLNEGRVWFEATKAGKLARIAAQGCSVFVDDLPEFLLEPSFPRGVRRVRFDPAGQAKADERYTRVRSWRRMAATVVEDLVRL